MFISINKKYNFSVALVVVLLFFLIDEFAFVLYNISLFQYMCSNTLSLFITDEVPLCLNIMNSDIVVAPLSSNSLYTVDTSVPLSLNLNYFCYEKNSILFLNSVHSESSITCSTVDLKFYKIKMEATNVKKNLLSFYPLQNYIYTIPGESTLIFYRLENLTDTHMQSLSVYVTSPVEAVSYIKKLQCFCYEELMISPKCIIDLPILFSLDEDILNEEFKELTINYILLLKDKK